MALPHFTNIETNTSLGDPVFKGLFEVDFILPPAVLTLHPEGARVLLENTITCKFPTYPVLPQIQQRFKFSTRYFLGLPEHTSFTDYSIKFNVNQNNQKQMTTFRIMKDVYDLGFNNEDGTTNMKKNVVFDTIIYQHDKEGNVIRRVTCNNCQMTGFNGVEELDWSSNNGIADLTITAVCDFFQDYYF